MFSLCLVALHSSFFFLSSASLALCALDLRMLVNLHIVINLKSLDYCIQYNIPLDWRKPKPVGIHDVWLVANNGQILLIFHPRTGCVEETMGELGFVHLDNDLGDGHA